MPQDPEQWSAATPAERLLLDEGASTPRANFDNLLNAVLAGLVGPQTSKVEPSDLPRSLSGLAARELACCSQ